MIAIMGDSYEKVKEREWVEGIRERAKTVVDMELRYPLMHEFPKYMLICEGAELDSGLQQPWAGVGGRVIQETSRVMKRVAKLDEDVKSGIQDVNSRVESVQERLATTTEVLSEVEAKIEDLGMMDAGSPGQISLVEQLERLAGLHTAGELDDEEYGLAKRAIIQPA